MCNDASRLLCLHAEDHGWFNVSVSVMNHNICWQNWLRHDA